MNNVVKTLMKPGQVRQGDVYFIPVTKPVDDDGIGKAVVESDKRRVVLAFGEQTGHAHACYPQDNEVFEEFASRVQLFELANAQAYAPFGKDESAQRIADTARLFRINERALLKHEEHHGIDFPAGDFLVVIQHEGDELGELRRVAD